MAKRRMFLENLIESDEFCGLPLQAQALYLHLNMSADDDGMVGSTARILRSLRISRKQLDLLCEAGYVICFESGVAAIVHWLSHNRIKKDRYTPSRYREELSGLKVVDDGFYVRATVSGNGAISEQKCPVSAPQVSIGKVSIVKDSLGKVSSDKDSSVEVSSDKDSSGKGSVGELRLSEVGCAVSGTDGVRPGIKKADSKQKSEENNGEFSDRIAILRRINSYFCKSYDNVAENLAFIKYYEQRGWRDESGKLIVNDVERYVDAWMKEKNGAPIGHAACK